MTQVETPAEVWRKLYNDAVQERRIRMLVFIGFGAFLGLILGTLGRPELYELVRESPGEATSALCSLGYDIWRPGEGKIC